MCSIHADGTEWDPIFVNCEVSTHELLTYVWICDLKGCYLCKAERNQSGILLFVVSEEVLAQGIQRREVQLP